MHWHNISAANINVNYSSHSINTGQTHRHYAASNTVYTKINWAKAAHHTHCCVVTGWVLGLLKASALGGWVIGYPPTANNKNISWQCTSRHTCACRFGDRDRTRLNVLASRECDASIFFTSSTADCSEIANSLARIRSCAVACRSPDDNLSLSSFSSDDNLPPAEVSAATVRTGVGFWPAMFAPETCKERNR